MYIGNHNMDVMDHTATIEQFGKIVIRTSRPGKGDVVLRLIRFTGEALAKLRAEVDLDQVDIARGSGLSQTHLSLFENEKQIPKGPQLVALQEFYSKKLGYKVVFYFDLDPEQKKTDPEQWWGQKA